MAVTPRLALGPALLLSLLACGCGGGAEPAPGGPAVTPRVDRGARPQPLGPDFDAPWLAHVPAGGFLYASFRDESLVQGVQALLPTSTREAGADAGRGLVHWLRRLRAGAGEAPLFPQGAALLLDAAATGAAEQEPLDFWVAGPAGPALEAALESSGVSPEGMVSGGPDHPPLFVGEAAGLRLLSSRRAWATGPGAGAPEWVLAARRQVRRGCGAYAVLSPRSYLEGPFGARTRLRSPDEAAFLERWQGLFPQLVLEVDDHRDQVVLDLWAPLAPGHPGHAALLGLFPAGAQLESPTRVPSSSPLYLGAALDWAALRALRGDPGAPAPTRPAPDRAAPAPFQESHGARHLADAGAAWKQSLTEVLATLEGWLLDWGGPEVALVGTWDAREPRLGLLVRTREPKRAVAAIREFRASEAGRKLRFADTAFGGVPVRYTRLDGVDPRWVEPAYAFVGSSLCLASHRSLLERLLEPGAPKLEEVPALGGLFARLGANLRLVAYVVPGILPRLAALRGRAQAADPGAARGAAPGGEAAPTGLEPLEELAQRVQSLAVGAGLEGDRLRLGLVVTRTPAVAEQPPGVDSEAAGAPR